MPNPPGPPPKPAEEPPTRPGRRPVEDPPDSGPVVPETPDSFPAREPPTRPGETPIENSQTGPDVATLNGSGARLEEQRTFESGDLNVGRVATPTRSSKTEAVLGLQSPKSDLIGHE
jgi:hypothetical protein